MSGPVYFGDIVEYNIGGGWGKESPEDGHNSAAYVIRGTDIPRMAVGDITTIPLRYHSESNLRARVLEPGDIVFEISGGSKGQPVGRSLQVNATSLASFSAPVICASFCKLVRVDREVAEPGFVYRLLQLGYADGSLDAYQVQSTGITNFRWKPFLADFNMLLPAKEVQRSIAEALDTFDELVWTLGQQSAHLRQMRELLLPKLLSGQLDISFLDLPTLDKSVV